MKKTKLFVLAIITLMIAIVTNNNVYATSEKNEVTLKFDGGIVRDGYVEYSQIGKLQLFRGDELVTNIDNEMKIDLNEADYKFVIEEIKIENQLITELEDSEKFQTITEIEETEKKINSHNVSIQHTTEQIEEIKSQITDYESEINRYKQIILKLSEGDN